MVIHQSLCCRFVIWLIHMQTIAARTRETVELIAVAVHLASAVYMAFAKQVDKYFIDINVVSRGLPGLCNDADLTSNFACKLNSSHQAVFTDRFDDVSNFATYA